MTIEKPSLPVIGPMLAYRMVDMLHLSEEDVLVIPTANVGELAGPVFTKTHKQMFSMPKMTLLIAENEKQAGFLKVATPDYEDRNVIVLTGHFLEMDSVVNATVVALGPPVGAQQDIALTCHAWKLLVPGGRLVALCSEEAFEGRTDLSAAFLAFLDVTRAAYTTVSPDSFSDKTTKARLVYLEKQK